MIHGLVGTEGVGNIAQQVVAEEGVYDTIFERIAHQLQGSQRNIPIGPRQIGI